MAALYICLYTTVLSEWYVDFGCALVEGCAFIRDSNV